tara:strand:- start:966 stop:1412 length:447 start_codon:yes stop_codon:yes gene_type:complete
VTKKNKINLNSILIASDHAGYKLKESIKKYLFKKKKSVLDLGPKNENSVDYPLYAHLLAKKIRSKNQFGILVCGSGTGMTITANKHKKVRAALCYNVKSTKLSRLHNNANVISLGARLTKKNVALRCINIFLKTKFEGGRHLRRINKI